MKAEPPISEDAGESNILKVLPVFAVLGFVFLVSNSFTRAEAQQEVTHCKINLKNVGAAMEMYSTDNNGRYPNDPALLIPNYLKTLPQCPSAATNTYMFEVGENATGNTKKYRDYYFLYCGGENHLAVGVPADSPDYNGIVGSVCRH